VVSWLARSGRSLGQLSTVGFDTSTINALERGGADSEALIKAIQSGFHVLLLGVNADEILSTPTSKDPRREILLTLFQRLLVSGECLWPPNYVVELLATEYFKNPSRFSWQRVPVRARIYERSIIERDFTDALCAQQRTEQLEHEKKWKTMWSSVRPGLDNLLATEQAKRPTSYHDFFANTALPGGLLLHFGGILCRRFVAREISDVEIEAFMDVCPPFRAACHGVVMSLYVHGLQLRPPGAPEPPGRNDLMVATFLPYLRGIAAEASIACNVLSYEKFSSNFVVKSAPHRKCPANAF
jgi:hypothetical protein